MRTIIFTNGNLFDDFLTELKAGDFVVGVDKAAYWLIQHQVIPDLAIGDFDSTNHDEFAKIKHACKNCLSYPPEKDFTDTELAIQEAVKVQPEDIVIFGATGTRMDHTLASISLLEPLLQQHISGCIKDLNNEIRLIDGIYQAEKNNRYTYFSVLPVTEIIELSLDGFVYNVDHVTIHRGQSLGVSNEITQNPAVIKIHSGHALIIQSKD